MDMEILKFSLETIGSNPEPSCLKHCRGCVYDGDCPHDICNRISLDGITGEPLNESVNE
jgi:hypothetical protein